MGNQRCATQLLSQLGPGCHQRSFHALESKNAATVQEDIQYQVDASFSKLFTWEEVQRLWPKQLKVPATAVVSQNNHHGGIILDLSFLVYPVCTSTHT